MKAVFYGRHSTDKQNLNTQLSRAYQFAKKYEVKIIGEYTDEAVSSRKKHRKGLMSLIEDAELRKFDFVIVYDHSRLARIPEDHQVLRVTMDAFGIDIVECLTETVYSKSAIITSTVKDALAKYELDKIRLVTKDSIKTLAQKGLWTGGPAPFGYKYFSKYPRKRNKNGERKDTKTYKEILSNLPEEMHSNIRDGKFEKVDHELMLVKEVYSLYKVGYGFDSIASKMPKNSYRGKNWDKDKVKQIIVNPFYAGYIAIRKRNPKSKNTTNERTEWIMTESDLIQPVITKSEWEFCYQLYERRKNKEIPPNYFKTNFWLTNLLFCKDCKTEIKGKDQRSKGYGKRIYYCPSCGSKFLESDVHSEVKNYLTSFHTMKIDEIVRKIQMKIESQCEELIEKIDLLRNIVLEVEKKLVDLKCKKEKIFSNLNEIDNEMKVKHIQVLTIAEDHLKNSISEKRARIEVLQDSINSLKNVDANREFIQDKIKDLYTIEGLPNVAVRRLFLYLLESVYIDSKCKIDIKLRMDLKNV
ncbi:recombinase family protein, partial [Neobacillus drentensis]|uniref:recombinase family protein n=1 Tax=Neobacillus drentensis TaxID=220684 RepID=UPI002FFFF844